MTDVAKLARLYKLWNRTKFGSTLPEDFTFREEYRKDYYGWVFWPKREIVINSRLSYENKKRVLLHEMIHIFVETYSPGKRAHSKIFKALSKVFGDTIE